MIENQFNWSNSPDGTEILRALGGCYIARRLKRQLENGGSKKPKSVASGN